MSPDCHVAIMCLLKHSVVEGQAEHIGLDETVTCSVTSGSYRHFVLVSEMHKLNELKKKGIRCKPILTLFISQAALALQRSK